MPEQTAISSAEIETASKDGTQVSGQRFYECLQPCVTIPVSDRRCDTCMQSNDCDLRSGGDHD